MDFALSEEQESLATVERAWLTRHDPIGTRRPGIDDGPARVPAAMRDHAAGSGLLGLLAPEAGGTHVDLAVLSEEHGRACSPLPLADAAIAAGLLHDLSHPLAVTAAAGEVIVVPATGAIEAPALDAEIIGEELRLSGRTGLTPGLIDADHVLVLARAGDGREVAAVLPAGSGGVTTRATLDLTRHWGTLAVDLTVGAGEWHVVDAGTLERVVDALATHRALDALGAAARLLDMTVEYAGQRVQFGEPIGRFQAVKHHCANMVLAVESSRVALWAAAVGLDDDDEVRRRAVAAAVAYSCEQLPEAAQTALQVHGGIGFTWEHDVHLLIRRITLDELTNGSVSYHRRRLVAG